MYMYVCNYVCVCVCVYIYQIPEDGKFQPYHKINFRLSLNVLAFEILILIRIKEIQLCLKYNNYCISFGRYDRHQTSVIQN